MSVSDVPVKLKPVTSYLKTANEIEKRDPAVAYYCRLYAVQRGMELDKQSPEGKKFLMELMDILDKMKKELKDHESIISETVGQAHVEDYALKLFSYADKKDRDGIFEQGTIRSFATAGFLMDVLSVFGEVGEDIEKCRKYAKWKAVYITQCLKNGEIPHAGPLGENQNEVAAPGPNDYYSGNSGVQQPGTPSNFENVPTPTPRTLKPSTTPVTAPQSKPVNSSGFNEPSNQAASSYYPDSGVGSTNLSLEDFVQAEKFCKYAASALQYQDSTTAIDYLTKCLSLLTKEKK